MKRVIATLCALCLLLAIPFAASAKAPDFCSAEEWEILKLTNEERIAEGKQPLSTFASIANAAGVRAEECTTLFSHTRPDGTDCETIFEDFSIECYFAGENLAAGQPTPETAVQSWMSSQGHRENILRTVYQHVGVGYTTKVGSEYHFYWSQLFAGGCTTTALSNYGELPTFDKNGRLLNDPALKVTCSLHGECYVPLVNLRPAYLGGNTYRVSFRGVTETLPCTTGTGYPDVFSDLWYWEGIQFVSEHGLMKGMPDGTFAPDQPMTRAELVTILYRLEGEPTATNVHDFTDVAYHDWFYKQIQWAAQEGLVNGMGDGSFAPNKPVTRAEMTTILLRYHKYTTGEGAILAPVGEFPDHQSVPAWAMEGMRWAVGKELISGVLINNVAYLQPQGNTTRAQIATVLMRYLK